MVCSTQVLQGEQERALRDYQERAKLDPVQERAGKWKKIYI